jgi:hypothetical protein
MLKYFAGFIATIVLIIILIMLIFHGGGKAKVNTTSKALDSYATTNAEVSLTVDGPIVADQNHQAIKITVSNSAATYEQIQGYQGAVQKQQSYPNNVDAYTNFLFALERAGFTEGDTSSTLKDERGYCPLGDRYIFQLNQGGQQLERFWTTNCSGTPKTFKGNAGLTTTLFKDQIPDYDSLSNNINL